MKTYKTSRFQFANELRVQLDKIQIRHTFYPEFVISGLR